MMSYLKLGELELDYIGTPQRGGLSPSQTRMVQVQPGYDGEEAWWDFGNAGGFRHTFASAGNVGHLTRAEVGQIMTMEASKQPFTLVTDLLSTESDNQTFTAYFDPQDKPQFTSVLPSGAWWAYVLTLYLIPQGG